MLNISLHTYKPGESVSGYNLPHKFRIEKMSGVSNEELNEQYKPIWKIKGPGVIHELIGRILDEFQKDAIFIFAGAPSTTRAFVDQIRDKVSKTFPNSIDKTSCFEKDKNFKAMTTDQILTENELREKFSLNSKCYNEGLPSTNLPILLLDDIYALGNTFAAMKLLISDLGHNSKILTAAILKTND